MYFVLFQGHQFSDVKTLDMDHSGIQIPDVVSPLDNGETETLTHIFNPVAPSCFGADIYCAVVQCVVDTRQEF